MLSLLRQKLPALLLLLGIPVSLASAQSSSLSKTPEHPVIKHSPGKAEAKATDAQEHPSSGSTVSDIAHAPSAPQTDRATQQTNSNSDAEAYRVKIVSQPTPQDSFVFILYVVLTGVATAVNCAIFFAILRQNKVNWRQAKISLRAARAATRAASAASRNVEGIIVSNTINREAMHRGQRAYVWFSPIDPIINGTKDKSGTYELTKWNVQLPIENAGNTPTKNLKIRFNWITRQDELPENFGYPDQSQEFHVPLIIGPKGRIFTDSMVFSNEDIQKIRRRELRLYFYGWATYNDVFEGTPLHRTEFCFEAHTYYAATQDVEVNIQLRFHRQHNSHT